MKLWVCLLEWCAAGPWGGDEASTWVAHHKKWRWSRTLCASRVATSRKCVNQRVNTWSTWHRHKKIMCQTDRKAREVVRVSESGARSWNYISVLILRAGAENVRKPKTKFLNWQWVAVGNCASSQESKEVEFRMAAWAWLELRILCGVPFEADFWSREVQVSRILSKTWLGLNFALIFYSMRADFSLDLKPPPTCGSWTRFFFF
jgi:hypothetical protein